MTEEQILEEMGRNIMELTEERDQYKADADRLAEAIERLHNYFAEPGEDDWLRFCRDILEPARAALTAHEGVKNEA
jgi:hypothetical protein